MEEVSGMTQTLTEVKPIKSERPAYKPHISWWQRAFFLCYWTEVGLEKESLLQEIIAFLVTRKYFIILDQGWSDWDLEFYWGIWSKAQIKVCTENHGGGKRLLRVRCALLMSQFATITMVGYFLLIVVGIILAMPQVAGVTVVVGGFNAVVILYQNFCLGRIVYYVLETVAKKMYLVPIHAIAQSLPREVQVLQS